MSKFENNPENRTTTVSIDDVEDAVRTLISWSGDNPDREGLLDTPKRVAKAFQEYFSGYHFDAEDVLKKTFKEVQGYDEIVLLKNMRFESHCEHHIAPIVGVAHIAYMPNQRVVGISKLARVLDIYSKRLQTQETLAMQIAQSIEDVLNPLGIAVIIDAAHHCMTTRGVHKPGTTTVTSQMRGLFKSDASKRQELMALINS